MVLSESVVGNVLGEEGEKRGKGVVLGESELLLETGKALDHFGEVARVLVLEIELQTLGHFPLVNFLVFVEPFAFLEKGVPAGLQENNHQLAVSEVDVVHYCLQEVVQVEDLLLNCVFSLELLQLGNLLFAHVWD